MSVASETRHRGQQPLHLRVKADILQLIRDRGLSDGDRVPQIRELAKMYAVSYVTAAKAVSALVEANVLDSRVGDGTYVRQGALAAETTTNRFTIAAVLRDVYSLDLFNLGATIRNVGGFAQQHNLRMQMLMVHEDESAAGVETLIEDVASQHIDGLIIASRVDPRLILRLQQERIPFVWVGDELPHHGTYSIMGSRVGGFLDAIRTLRQLGQSRVAVMHVPFMHPASEALRIDARLNHQPFDPASEVVVTHDRDTVRDATERLLNQGFDALVCSDEQMAAWSQERAIEMGKAIPADLIYATFAAPASNFPMPAPFVGLCAPMDDMAREACALLLKILDGEEQPTYQSIFDMRTLIPASIRNRKQKSSPR